MPLQNQPFMQPVDGAGKPYAGALAYYYLTGGVTTAEVFHDAGLSTAHSQPVEADANGIFPDVYTDPAVTYRLVLKTAGGTTIIDVDPIGGGGAVGTDDLGDNSVSEAKLADDSVSTRTLQAQAVSNDKMTHMPDQTFKGRTAGSTGAPQDIAVGDLYDLVLRPIVAGSVHMFAHGSWDAERYLLCNGQVVSRTTYDLLFGKIGTVFGAGDGSTTFKLPDYRGAFLRGRNSSGGLDPDGTRGYGAVQSSANLAHSHTGSLGTSDTADTPAYPADGSGAGGSYTTNASGGTEARPVNYPVDFVMAY